MYIYMISKYILASLLQIWTTGFIHLSHVDSITHSAENKGGTKKNFSLKMLYKAFIFHFPTSPLTALCWILFRLIVFAFSLTGHWHLREAALQWIWIIVIKHIMHNIYLALTFNIAHLYNFVRTLILYRCAIYSRIKIVCVQLFLQNF